MRIVLLGRNGQVGNKLYPVLKNLGNLFAFDRSSLDITDATKISAVLREIRPKVIVNAAAYTQVDRAESEPDLAMQVNALAPQTLAEISNSLHATLIHFSTDYVFDGESVFPYREDDIPHPINVYGSSKLAGEKAIQDSGCAFLILRTSWVYSLQGDSFVTKILAWSRKSRELRIVSDQIGSPTWAGTLAEVVGRILSRADFRHAESSRAYSGIYHVTDLGIVSRLEWAQAILRYDSDRGAQITETVHSALSSEFKTPARRPSFSALNCEKIQKTFDFQLQGWEEKLKIAMKD
jgi:dTDP-4-dehydrorhamnose reductase